MLLVSGGLSTAWLKTANARNAGSRTTARRCIAMRRAAWNSFFLEQHRDQRHPHQDTHANAHQEPRAARTIVVAPIFAKFQGIGRRMMCMPLAAEAQRAGLEVHARHTGVKCDQSTHDKMKTISSRFGSK